jgi:YHS domain-containing protein
MMLRTISTLVLATAVMFGAACARDAPEPLPAAPAATDLASGLRRITDPSLVCMVNDTFMGKPQIPVDVAGKTYFGCCPMCKERLAKEPETRAAVDPVTGETVDKATAVLAQNEDGTVLYFASDETLRRYRGAR